MRARWWILAVVVLGTAMTSQTVDPKDLGIRIDAVTPAKDDSVVAISVQLSDLSTGEAVTEADVEVTFHQDDDAPSDPQALEGDGDGFFRGDVTFPSGGEWIIDITADGGGSVQLTQQVAEPKEPEGDGSSAESDSTDDGAGSAGTIAVVVGLAVLLALVIVLVVRRRRRPREDATG